MFFFENAMKNTCSTSDIQVAHCGASYTAYVSDLSQSTVQKIAEFDNSITYKMQGGPRRLTRQTTTTFQVKNSALPNANLSAELIPQVLIVEDDDNTRKMYEACFKQWNLPLEVVIYSSAINALVDLHLLSPMVLLTDLHMSNMDGFQFIRAVREYKSLASLPIIAITGMTNEKIQDHGGLDGDVLILKKPIDMDWLRGFLQAIVSMKNDD
jgi:CheY-like chemotaxis protein